MSNKDAEEITQEIGLLDIYKASRGKLSRSRINNISSLIVLGLLLFYSTSSEASSEALVENIRSWAEVGFSFSAGILGFLIAGFTIFATVSDITLFTAMARVREEESGLNYLKKNFFSLMYVFIVYILFAAICLLVILLGAPSGFMSVFLKSVLNEQGFLAVKRLLASLGVVVLGTWFFYALILLQSFIFNIYHIVMTAIGWQIEKERNRHVRRKRMRVLTKSSVIHIIIDAKKPH